MKELTFEDIVKETDSRISEELAKIENAVLELLHCNFIPHIIIPEKHKDENNPIDHLFGCKVFYRDIEEILIEVNHKGIVGKRR